MAETTTTSRGLRGLFEHADFRRLLIGQGISSFGDWMATVALMALVHEITGSALAVGGVLVLRLAPTVVAGPLAPRIVDRWNRRRTMLAMDLFRTGTVALIPFVASLWWIYLWAFMLEAGSLVFLPARDAAVPDLLDTDDDLPLANGLVLGSSFATIPIGAGAFGVITGLAGPLPAWVPGGAMGLVFWADAVTFMVSFAMIWRIGRIPHEAGAAAEGADRPEAAREQDEAPGTIGFLEALRLPIVRPVAPVAAVASLGLGALFSLGIVFIKNVLGASNTEFGVLVALFGVGAAVGLGAIRLFGQPGFQGILFTMGVQGAVVAGMSLSPGIGTAFVGAVLFGALTSVALASSMSILQEELEGGERVMAFTAFHVVIKGGLAVAAIAAGAAGDALQGVSWPLVGTISPARVVLFASGIVVVLTAAVAHRLTPPDVLAVGPSGHDG